MFPVGQACEYVDGDLDDCDDYLRCWNPTGDLSAPGVCCELEGQLGTPCEDTVWQPCTTPHQNPTDVLFSTTAISFQHARVTPSPDDSRGPTDKQVGRKLAALREVMGFDVEALAARSQLAADLILAIEAGTHSANVDELSDLAFALGVTITALARPVDRVR